MLGTLKKYLGQGIAVVEKTFLPPAPLPSSILTSRVVLLGASVAHFWQIDVRYPCIDVRPLYSFDKSSEVDRLLSSFPLPDAIIIKQCAAYFPLPLEEKKDLVLSWLDRIVEAGIVPIVATVVPVTAQHDRAVPGRLDGLLAYNRWIRSVAKDRDLPLLDLAEAVQKSGEDQHLDELWATRDGLHLRRMAYRRRLDPIVQSVLVKAFSAR